MDNVRQGVPSCISHESTAISPKLTMCVRFWACVVSSFVLEDSGFRVPQAKHAIH